VPGEYLRFGDALIFLERSLSFRTPFIPTSSILTKRYYRKLSLYLRPIARRPITNIL
jgi:hypothetical protein